MLVAALPVAVTCSGAHYAVTREWAGGFLPDLPAFVLLPLPVVVVLSLALCCVLAATWACQRKPLTPEDASPPG